DAATKKPLADVVVTAESPAMQGAKTVVTDRSGTYLIPDLPPGTYTVRVDGDGYKPFVRNGINMRLDTTIRFPIEILPDSLKNEEVVIIGKAPTIDVGSSSTGLIVNQALVSHLALTTPGTKNSASRSFESIAALTPGATADMYGVTFNGTTSPENSYQID